MPTKTTHNNPGRVRAFLIEVLHMEEDAANELMDGLGNVINLEDYEQFISLL